MKFAILMMLLAFPLAAREEQLPPKLRQEADKIRTFGEDRILVGAVRDQNKSPMTMEQILKLDQDWVQGAIAEDFVNKILSNPCALHLKDLEKEVTAAQEAFVMDAQGALVCASRKTSDYYQGDEDKWKDAYLDGKGALFVGKRQYDESTKSTLVHVSAPILDKGKAIGVIAVGINLTKLAEE